MRVGSDYQIINPNIGCQMEGYESRFSTGKHDDLTVSTMFLKEGTKEILFVALDLVAVPAYRADRLKRQIFINTKINEQSIIISAVHTHSGPTVTDLLLDVPQIDELYWQKVIKKTVYSVKRSLNKLRDGHLELRLSKIQPGIYANRNDLSIPYNNQLIRIVALDNDDNILSTLLLLGSHPTVMNSSNTLLTSDLVGAVRSVYQTKYKVRPMIMLTDCGDTSTRFTRKESSFTEMYRLASEIVDSLKITDLIFAISIKDLTSRSVEMSCFYNPITNFKSIKLWQNINQKYISSKNETRQKLKGFLNTYNHIRNYGHTHFKTNSFIFETSTFRIVTYPGELVSELGTRIREADNKPTLLITLANDYRGYSVNKEAFGKYFETYNSVFLKDMADDFVSRIVMSELDKISE